ncbi:cation-translocating P-type ATPase [Lacipirellula limnantheis]|uniref:Calcium-transporting ATPase n=1 Tax=Lacipirellula limnantheis TaxID=2528024 RepID=A0A517TYZ9_9BACT|nr:cation-translocating P-type ATPase [Lacipirellula limnantheis]QDT73592.1 Calcium-transporting ATPase [Lacipirellula limnantheis]
METNSGNDALIGLSEADVSRRLLQHGHNELPSSKGRSILATAWDVVREPMFLLLLACGTIYLILGDVQEALMLLGFVFVVLGITLYQERKTERALEALRDLSSPRALVIRGGQRKRIAGREVVPDDLVVLAEGDRVPADSVVLSCTNLSTDESLLTGESVPVRKVAWDGVREMTRPGGEDLPFVFSGTLVVQGQGIAQVRATGLHTEMGNIGKALQTVEVEGTRLQKEVGQLVRRVAILGLILCVMVVVLYGLARGNWLQGFLAGITLAMAMLPEEFPVVLTIFLALGAWRLSKIKVLARRVPVIETLGSATVLCVDKTGTLTVNRMSIRKLAVDGTVCDVEQQEAPPLPEPFHEIVEFGILASQRDPFDPMEKAFHDLGNDRLAQTEHLHADWRLERGYPLSTSLLAMSHVWMSPTGHDYVLAAKGAPEAIADLCHLSAQRTQAIGEQVTAMAQDGLRVLGVAKGVFGQKPLPGEQHDFTFEFLGLVALADPVRPTVPAAVEECYTAGIRVIMITGDHPTTAKSIARQAGIKPLDEIITGAELDEFNEAELQQRVRTTNVFARMVPEQKLRLVNALKANGEVVAMTGDGVNDAPALKAAHIGIAMGGRGTDVAREAASLVLLDDDFASIVQSVRMGRRIFDHLQKAMTYIVAVHVPIAGLSLVPVLLGGPLALLPVHILFLELIIDPACSVVFEAEPEDANVMKRPPRNPLMPLFGRRILGLGLLQGTSVLLIVLAVYVSALWGWLDIADAIALSFTTLVVANLGLIFANRSWTRTILSTLRTPNVALWYVFGGTIFFLSLALYVPFLRDLFHFSTLHPNDLALCIAAGSASILWFESLKWFKQKSRT